MYDLFLFIAFLSWVVCPFWLSPCPFVFPNLSPLVSSSLGVVVLVFNASVASFKEESYTADSWKVFKDALLKAQEVLNNENATQEEVNQAYGAKRSYRCIKN